MSVSASFVEQMRARVNLGMLWSDIKWSALDLLLGICGFYIVVSPDAGSGAGTVLLGAGMIIGAIVGAVFLVRRAKTRRSPAGHPLNLQLAAYGDQAAVARAIDAEFAGRPFVAGRINLGRRWLCYVRKTQVTVVWLDHLVWAYEERIKHSINYLIPYRPASHQLIVWDRFARAAVLPVRKKDIQPAFEALHKAAPWMFFGHNEALKESWNADHGEFIAVVDARRQSALESRPSSQAG